MAVVTELVTKFSFKGSLAPLGKFQKGLKSSTKLILGFKAGFVTAKAAITAFTVLTLASADALGQLAVESGVSTEEIQKLGFAASVSGSSANALQSSISNLSSKIGEAAQKGSEEFSRLGISVRKSNGEVKNSSEIMDELRQRFRTLNLSMQEQRKFTDALGIDKSLLQLLNKSSSEINKLKNRAAALGLVTAKQTAKIIEFNDSLTTLKFGTSALQKQFAIALAPEIKNLADNFTNLLITNKDLISNGITKMIKVIGDIVTSISNFADLIFDLIESTIGWKNAFLGVSSIMAAALTPFQLIMLAITAAILIIDDLIVAFQGGKSVIRDFFQEFFGIDIRPILQDIVKAFKIMIGSLKMLLVGFSNFSKVVWEGIAKAMLGDFQGAFNDIAVANQELGNIIIDIFTNIFSLISEPLDKFTQKIKDLVISTRRLLGLGDDEAAQNSANLQTTQNTITPNSANIQRTQNTRNSIVQDINITVETNNPEIAGDSIVNALQAEYRAAMQQTGLGGR